MRRSSATVSLSPDYVRRAAKSHNDFATAKNIGFRLLTVPEGKRPSGLGDGQLAPKSGTVNGNGEYTPDDPPGSADRESTGKPHPQSAFGA